MFRPGVEETVRFEGLCKIFLDHPSVDVDQFALAWEPEYSEPPTVPTALVGIGLYTNPLVFEDLRQFAAGVVPLMLFCARDLRGIDSQEPHPHFWQEYAEPELYRYVHRVAVANLGDLADVIIGRRADTASCAGPPCSRSPSAAT